jgi:hypothetical protein
MNAVHLTVTLGNYLSKAGVDTFTSSHVKRSGIALGSPPSEQACMDLAARLYQDALSHQARFNEVTTEDDRDAATRICAEVPGYSTAVHYAFFRQLISDLLSKHDWPLIAILGVYRGRDISFLLDIMARFHPLRTIGIVGVDRFQDLPSDDWPEHKRGLSWKAAGYNQPPSFEAALEQVEKRKGKNTVILSMRDDAEFLRDCAVKFHCMYLDTSHDKPNVVRQIRACDRLLVDEGVLCGDDFSDAGTWGVESAVKECVSRYAVFGDWIWMANKKDIKPCT